MSTKFSELNHWLSVRPISTSQLNALLHLHLRPINVIVSHGSYLKGGNLFLWGASHLDGPLVLGTAPLKFPTPTADRDRTVSRRSEPSSRTSLMGEQPNPWDLLQPQDETSRHRGAKHRRRCELLGGISLLSPG